MGEHKPRAELLENVAAFAEKITVGADYQHFRNGIIYRVLGFTTFEEDDSVLVRYCPVDDPELEGSRRADVWLDQVEHEGRITARFTLLQAAADELGGDEADRQANAWVDIGADIVEP